MTKPFQRETHTNPWDKLADAVLSASQLFNVCQQMRGKTKNNQLFHRQVENILRNLAEAEVTIYGMNIVAHNKSELQRMLRDLAKLVRDYIDEPHLVQNIVADFVQLAMMVKKARYDASQLGDADAAQGSRAPAAHFVPPPPPGGRSSSFKTSKPSIITRAVNAVSNWFSPTVPRTPVLVDRPADSPTLTDRPGSSAPSVATVAQQQRGAYKRFANSMKSNRPMAANMVMGEDPLGDSPHDYMIGEEMMNEIN